MADYLNMGAPNGPHTPLRCRAPAEPRRASITLLGGVTLLLARHVPAMEVVADTVREHLDAVHPTGDHRQRVAEEEEHVRLLFGEDLLQAAIVLHAVLAPTSAAPLLQGVIGFGVDEG